MKIYYWNYRQLLMAGLLGVFLLGAGLVLAEKFRPELKVTVPPATPQPIIQGGKEKAKISLAFNVDWGEEYVPDMLKQLEANQTKVTFFVTGRWAKKFPELTQEMSKKGHEIGNHGYSHPHPDRISKEKNQQEIISTDEAIREATGKGTKFFAPPYGEHGAHVVEAAHDLGFKTVLWTIDSVDMDKSRSAEVIYQRVTEQAENGAIVLMHPTDRTLQALPAILKGLKEKGFDLVTITELLQ